ncbi:MAG: recombinase family protein [Propionibacteriaceae bacterium]|jgi:DNA invertase Pin-like site-specific DNA recombinase
MKAAVYLRQSKDHNDDRLAVARQREDCLKICRARGWEPAEYEDNDRSAHSGKRRPRYQEMLADIEAGELDAVVTWDLDRLHRVPIELGHFMELADRHRLELATVTGDVDLSTDNGRLYARLKGAVAADESNRKSARQKRAGLQRAELGKPKAGPRPFGYEPDMITIRESEARALRAAYASLLAGGSLLGISRDLDAAGFRASSGKPFHHARVHKMLRNPRYAGLRGYSTRGRDKKLHTEIIGPAQWEGIVDEETWRAVDALLADPSRRSNHVGPARKWLLGNLALCGRCDDGTTMRINYREARGKQTKSVAVYKCRERPHLSRVAEWCDWRVTERVIARVSRNDARDLLIDDKREDLAALRVEKHTLQLRLDQLAEDYADGTITRAQLKAGSERLRARLSDLEKRMVHVDRAPLLADLVTAEDVRTAWNGIGLDRQRAVVDLLYTITLMPRPAGNGPAPLDSVRMEPKQ